MKQGIHPKYEAVTITCSCGNVINTRSTMTGTLNRTCAANATRSTPVSSVLLTLVVVLIASTSVSASGSKK